jgi:hypothetical protein
MPILLSEYVRWNELCKLSLLKTNRTVVTPVDYALVEFVDCSG